jgi:hypothetical protein
VKSGEMLSLTFADGEIAALAAGITSPEKPKAQKKPAGSDQGKLF